LNELQQQDIIKTQTKKKILKSTQKEKQILSAALECFAKKGLSQTTLSDISKHSKVSSSHILYHFKNTHEIFLRLVQEMFKDAQIRAKDYTRKATGPDNKLEAYIHAMFDWLFANKDYQKLFLQFQSECAYQPELKNLRHRIHQSGIDYFYYLIRDSDKALVAQNLLTGSLIDFCLDHIQNVKIRDVTVTTIKKALP
jgi:AcrR family transcriptional regulator